MLLCVLVLREKRLTFPKLTTCKFSDTGSKSSLPLRPSFPLCFFVSLFLSTSISLVLPNSFSACAACGSISSICDKIGAKGRFSTGGGTVSHRTGIPCDMAWRLIRARTSAAQVVCVYHHLTHSSNNDTLPYSDPPQAIRLTCKLSLGNQTKQVSHRPDNQESIVSVIP